MRSAPNNYENTLLKIQSEINEVTRRENELRELHKQNSLNGDSTTLPSKSETKVLQRAVSTSNLSSANNGRRFIPNSKGVMQKFFKLRGKVSAVSAISANSNPNPNLNPVQNKMVTAWNADITIQPPVKALIPTDKPLRKGYVPVEARILSELREMENREHELKIERRRSQSNLTEPNLFSEDNNSYSDYDESSRTPSPATFNKLKPARSLSQLLDEDYESQQSTITMKPARSLAQLCDIANEEIVSSKSLIKQWESRIKESQQKDT